MKRGLWLLALLAGSTGAALAAPTDTGELQQEATEATQRDALVQSLEDDLGRLRRRVETLEERLNEAEQRLDKADSERALGLLDERGAADAIGAVVVEAGENVPKAVAFGGPLDIHGQVTGSAVSFGGDVRVHNGAFVEGDAVSFGGRVIVDEGGAVDGNRVTLGQPATGSLLSTRLGGLEPGTDSTSLAHRLVVLLSFAGAGVLVVGLFPRQVDNVARTIAARPVQSGMLGVLLSGLGAILAVVLAITLVGLPVSLFLVVLVALAWLLGFVGLCQAAGDLLPWANRGARRWLAFLVGVLVLTFVGSLPIVGQLVFALTGFVCIGAGLQTRLGNREFED